MTRISLPSIEHEVIRDKADYLLQSMSTFDEATKNQGGKLVVIECYATWCGKLISFESVHEVIY